MLLVEPSKAPFSVTVAKVSRPWQTNSTVLIANCCGAASKVVHIEHKATFKRQAHPTLTLRDLFGVCDRHFAEPLALDTPMLLKMRLGGNHDVI
jgi:hypothetical protein